MKKISIIITFCMAFTQFVWAQEILDTTLKRKLKEFVYETDTVIKNKFITSRAFNIFLQKKSSVYLTGASEVSVSKLYATYSSDNDKFNFGVNFRNKSDEEKLSWLLTPILETNIKKGFATFYKKGEWQSDIRLGLKYSKFFGGKIRYNGMDRDNEQETSMIIIRNRELAKILEVINKDFALKTDDKEGFENLLLKSLKDLRGNVKKAYQSGKDVTSMKRTESFLNTLIKGIEARWDNINRIKGNINLIDSQVTAINDRIRINDNIRSNHKIINAVNDSLKTLARINNANKESLAPAKRDLAKYLQDKVIEIESVKAELEDTYKSQIANSEVTALYRKGTYNVFKTWWFSAWGFLPLTERKTFIAANTAQNFNEHKLSPWEANVQLNWLKESNKNGSVYLSGGVKIFQNNTASADLMTLVDYYQYSQFPVTSATVSNLAVLDNNKAYIGDFKEFVTGNFFFQAVATLSDKNSKGEERFCTVGLSFKAEQNLGDFRATNLMFGIPLRLKGKSTPINLEPQIVLNNINNYSNKIDYKLQPIIGINVGLPFTALYK